MHSRKKRAMFASTELRFMLHSHAFRWTARVSAMILFAIWVSFFTYELSHMTLSDHSINTYGQAASLAIVFAGYAIGWRRKLAGRFAAIIGTLAFFAAFIRGSRRAVIARVVLR
jgi:hypothetical protein